MMRKTAAVLLSSALIIALACTRSDHAMSQAERSQWNKGRNLEARPGGKDQPEPRILPETYFAAGQLHEKQGNFTAAAAQYRKTILANHHHVGAYHRLGVVLGRSGRVEEAVQALTRAMELSPDAPVIHNDLGFCFALLQKWHDAELHLRRAVELKEDFTRAYVNLGLVLAKQNRFDDALAAFQTVLPEPDAWYNLGLLLQNQKQYGEAARAYEKVLALYPEFSAAAERLAELNARLSAAPAFAVVATAETAPAVPAELQPEPAPSAALAQASVPVYTAPELDVSGAPYPAFIEADDGQPMQQYSGMFDPCVENDPEEMNPDWTTEYAEIPPIDELLRSESLTESYSPADFHGAEESYSLATAYSLADSAFGSPDAQEGYPHFRFITTSRPTAAATVIGESDVEASIVSDETFPGDAPEAAAFEPIPNDSLPEISPAFDWEEFEEVPQTWWQAESPAEEFEYPDLKGLFESMVAQAAARRQLDHCGGNAAVGTSAGGNVWAADMVDMVETDDNFFRYREPLSADPGQIPAEIAAETTDVDDNVPCAQSLEPIALDEATLNLAAFLDSLIMQTRAVRVSAPTVMGTLTGESDHRASGAADPPGMVRPDTKPAPLPVWPYTDTADFFFPAMGSPVLTGDAHDFQMSPRIVPPYRRIPPPRHD